MIAPSCATCMASACRHSMQRLRLPLQGSRWYHDYGGGAAEEQAAAEEAVLRQGASECAEVFLAALALAHTDQTEQKRCSLVIASDAVKGSRWQGNPRYRFSCLASGPGFNSREFPTPATISIDMLM